MAYNKNYKYKRRNKKNYKRRKSSIKKYSSSERKSYRNGFLAGLFARKKKRNSSKKTSDFRTVNKIPLNYQHNVLFSDERYRDMYKSYIDNGFEVGEAYKLAIPKYKKKYGDSVLKEHYNIT